MYRTAAGLTALAVTTGIALGETGSATDQQVAELTDLVGELRQEIDELRQETDDNWLTDQRAEEIRGLVQDVLADADTRASLLQSGMTAGHDGKFFLASADGNFRLNIAGQIQVRYVFNYQDGPDSTPPNTDDSYREGFEIRRSKIKFAGHVFDPSWEYALVGAFSRSGGELEFEDVFIKKSFGNGFAVKAGAFKIPFNREELVSSGRQQLVDRSLINEAFNLDRGEGVELSYKTDQFGIYGYYGDGRKSRRTGWNDYLTSDPDFDDPGGEYAFAARAEILFAGDWKQFKDMQGWRGDELGFLLGGGIFAQSQEFGTTDDDELQQWALTLDGSLEGDGWNVFASLFYTEFDNDADVDSQNPWGVTLQGGFFVTDDWDLFLRFEYGDTDAPEGLDLSDSLTVLTGGANWYFNKNKLKWTNDIGYSFDAVQGVFGSTGAGWRTDGNRDDDGQFVLRSQVQLLF